MSKKWDLSEKLFYYVERRDLKNITKLLDDGANATKVTTHGRSAIGQATFKGFPEILIVLLKSCDEEYVSYSGGTAKRARTEHSAERTPDGMDGLQWDDEIQLNGNTPDDEWSRLYMYYARMFEQTGEILANTVRLKDPHCLDAYHQAPIHYAAVLGHVECLEILLQKGSPVDITTQNGITPLHLAVKNSHIVDILLKKKADPNKKTYNTGETALHVTARMGDVKVVELLLDAGAELNATNFVDRTPLMIATQGKNVDMAYCLIRRGARLNLQDHEGYTALYFAATTNNIPLASYLLQCGARLFVTHYLLHFCVRNNLQEMAKILIDAGENMNVRDFAGCTPLFHAIKYCNETMVEFLLQNGAQRFGRDDNVVQELHVAVQNAESVEQFAKVARVLIAYGVSINDYNYWCETPTMLAIMLDKYKIAEFLIKEGAEVNKGRSENIVDNFLLARRTTNLNLLILLVNAGLKLNPIPRNLKPPPWNNVDCNLEDWLAFTCSNPFSLQQLCRIRIRNSLIRNINTRLADINSYSESRLLQLIRQTGMPPSLYRYLSDFNDLPPIAVDRTPTLRRSLARYEF